MDDRVGQQLGQYRLLRILGYGGFANVYLGEHIFLGTHAALKVLQMRVAREDLESFLHEARTIAALKHPHIVRVLDFGVASDLPFLVMEYAPLGTLRQRHPRGSQVPLTTMVSYIKQVASALQYAHQQRLVHRDVKPENMLLETENHVLLSDFGIALVAQSSRYQHTQETVGTISYMAPEQLQGKPRPASDQYALGIVVYEWLSGDRPFHGSFTEMYSQHLFVPPPPLSQRVPWLPRDVEAVVQRALAKDPQQRFPTVQDFADALEQASQDVLPTARGEAHGWSQPSQGPQAHSVSAAPLPPLEPTQAVAADSPISAPSPLREGAERARPQRATVSRRTVILGALGLVAAGGGLTWLALLRKPTVTNSAGATSPTTSSHQTSSSAGKSPTSTPPPPGYLLFTYQGHTASVGTVAWSPDGSLLASGSADRTAQVWDAHTYRTLVTYRGHSGGVQSLAWSPDGSRIVSGGDDHTLQVWEASTAAPLFTLSGHSDTVWMVGWSPDGTALASASNDGTVRVWDAGTGASVRVYRGHSDFVYCLAWAPDSQRIASGSNDRTVQVWEAQSGQLLSTYRGHSNLVATVAWSPHRTQMASGSRDKTVQIWEVSSGRTQLVYTGHIHQVNTAAWSSDGSRIASASNDDTVQVWNAKTGSTELTYRRHTDYVWCAAWSPDDTRMASSCNDGTVQIWQVA